VSERRRDAGAARPRPRRGATASISLPVGIRREYFGNGARIFPSESETPALQKGPSDIAAATPRWITERSRWAAPGDGARRRLVLRLRYRPAVYRSAAWSDNPTFLAAVLPRDWPSLKSIILLLFVQDWRIVYFGG